MMFCLWWEALNFVIAYAKLFTWAPPSWPDAYDRIDFYEWRGFNMSLASGWFTLINSVTDRWWWEWFQLKIGDRIIKRMQSLVFHSRNTFRRGREARFLCLRRSLTSSCKIVTEIPTESPTACKKWLVSNNHNLSNHKPCAGAAVLSARRAFQSKHRDLLQDRICTVHCNNAACHFGAMEHELLSDSYSGKVLSCDKRQPNSDLQPFNIISLVVALLRLYFSRFAKFYNGAVSWSFKQSVLYGVHILY